MAWDNDEEWPDLSDDPEAVERRRQAMREVAAARQRVLRWVYGGLGILLIVVIVLAVTR